MEISNNFEKNELSNESKCDIIKASIINKTKIDREILTQECGDNHIVQKGEGLWRIILNKYKVSVNPKLIEHININPGDNILFLNQIIIINHITGKKTYINLDELNLKPVKIKKEVKEEEKNTIQEMDYESFLELSYEQRFRLVTKKLENGYYEIKFPNKTLEKKSSINDIIPQNFSSVEVIKNKEYITKDGDKLRKNYFDIGQRENGGKFESIFTGGEYKSISIFNGYIIKPGNVEINDFSDTIFDKNSNKLGEQIAYENEKIVRSLYGDFIKEIVGSLSGKTVIDEKFIYSILAQESHFNPNAISPTGARGLGQLTGKTTMDIINRNGFGFLNKNFEGEGNSEYIVDEDNFLDIGDNYDIYKIKDKLKYSGLSTELYIPVNSILLCINYLLLLEKEFREIKDPEIKRLIIAASYNMGAGKFKKLTRGKLKQIKNIDDIKNILRINGIGETLGYVHNVNGFYGD